MCTAPVCRRLFHEGRNDKHNTRSVQSKSLSRRGPIHNIYLPNSALKHCEARSKTNISSLIAKNNSGGSGMDTILTRMRSISWLLSINVQIFGLISSHIPPRSRNTPSSWNVLFTCHKKERKVISKSWQRPIMGWEGALSPEQWAHGRWETREAVLLQAILSRLVFGSNLTREDQLHSQRT